MDVAVGILVLLGIVPFALLVRGAVWCGVSRMVEQWDKTAGVFVKTETDGKQALALEYHVGGETFVSPRNEAASAKHFPGDSVEIFYNPQKPKDFLIASELASKKLGMISAAVGALGLALLAGCYVLLEWLL